MREREQLEQALMVLEGQRATLGDAVVEAALNSIREKLATLQEAPPPSEQQRKQATILFADISGLSVLSEKMDMDVEDVMELINRLWQRLDRVIVAHGGTIDKHIGDQVMAVWGTQGAREDDPERAIRAALALQAELQQVEVGGGAAPLQIRSGINTGPVLLGAVGTTGEYTAMGDTVNLASRLAHAAPPGRLLISHDSYRHVRGLFDVQALDPLVVRGKREPVQVYLVYQAKPRVFRLLTQGVVGVETRMIGRSRELERLQAGLQRVIAGGTLEAFTVVGEAGVGKSRLLYELRSWLELLPEMVILLNGRASQEMMRAPFALIRDVFAFRCGILENDPASLAREKLERGLTRFFPNDAEALLKSHFIGHLLGLDFSASPHLRGILDDAKQIHDRARTYLVQLFTNATLLRPSLLLLEDIHWADDESLALLLHLLQQSRTRRLMVLCLARPTLFERRPDWMEESEGIQTLLRLRPLTKRQSRQLVKEILRKLPAVPEALRELVVSAAEGYPFYVEELIKMLIEEGVIVRGEEAWHVDPTRLVAVRVPPTLTGILQARLDALPPDERETLQRAAVLGRLFWDSALAYLQRGSDVDVNLQQTLARLGQRELIQRQPVSDFAAATAYSFNHTLLREVAYESILKRQRRAYHLLAAAWVSSHSGSRAEEYAGLIAEHYERAGESDQAAEWYSRAGSQALSTSANPSAIDYYQKALTLLQGHARGPILLPLGTVLELVGQWDAAEGRYREVLALLAEAAPSEDGSLEGVEVLRSQAQRALGQLLQKRGSYEEALEWLGRAQDACVAFGDHDGLAQTLTAISDVHWSRGDFSAARGILEEARALSLKQDNQATIVRSTNLLGRLAWRQGELETARALLEENLQLVRTLDDKVNFTFSLNILGIIAIEQGSFEEALLLLEESLALRQELGDKQGMARSCSNLGILALLQQDYATARQRFEEGMALSEEIGDLSHIARQHCNLGNVTRLQAELVAARHHYRESLRLSARLGDKQLIAYGLAGLAAVTVSATPDAAHARLALRWAAAADALLTANGAVWESDERPKLDDTLAAARILLPDPADFDAAWSGGADLSWEEALAEVMDEGN